MKLLVLTLFFAAVLVLQVPSLIRGKYWREITIYSLMLLPAMVYSYAYILDIKLPTPTDAISAAFKPTTLFLEKLLLQ